MNNRNTPLIFSKKISRHFGKNIWLKLEIYNSTGCHKDRECELMVSDAKKKGYSTVGCASTGNLAISLAFYAKKNGLKFENARISMHNTKKIMDRYGRFKMSIFF